MTAPVAAAQAALASRLATALVSAGFLTDPAQLEIEPTSAFDPQGDETEIVTAAALLGLQTRTVNTLLGPLTYVLERDLNLELAAAGPGDLGAALAQGLAALAAVFAADVTLGGAVEWLQLGPPEDADMGPAARQTVVQVSLRFRSGDPLGQTAPA